MFWKSGEKARASTTTTCELHFESPSLDSNPQSQNCEADVTSTWPTNTSNLFSFLELNVYIDDKCTVQYSIYQWQQAHLIFDSASSKKIVHHVLYVVRALWPNAGCRTCLKVALNVFDLTLRCFIEHLSFCWTYTVAQFVKHTLYAC